MIVRWVPIKTAKRFIRLHHRHAPKLTGGIVALGLFVDGALRGVAVVGRGARLDPPESATITRICTDGCRNGCSKLYVKAKRLAQAMGFTGKINVHTHGRIGQLALCRWCRRGRRDAGATLVATIQAENDGRCRCQAALALGIAPITSTQHKRKSNVACNETRPGTSKAPEVLRVLAHPEANSQGHAPSPARGPLRLLLGLLPRRSGLDAGILRAPGTRVRLTSTGHGRRPNMKLLEALAAMSDDTLDQAVVAIKGLLVAAENALLCLHAGIGLCPDCRRRLQRAIDKAKADAE